MSQAYLKLSQKFSQLEKVLEKRSQNKNQRKKKKEGQVNDLYQSIQQKTDLMISKLQELKRKQTILITMEKIQPTVPQNFPKNYFIQVSYEDVVVTDFDENLIQEKFIIPLLTSSKAKVQIWTAQQQPVLFDKMQLNLERVIQECLMGTDKYEDQVNINQCPDTKITFRVQLQGIGFSSWLKNINLLRQMQAQKENIKQQQRKRRQQTRNKLQQKKKLFNRKFTSQKIQQTKQYENQTIQRILDFLAND